MKIAQRGYFKNHGMETLAHKNLASSKNRIDGWLRWNKDENVLCVKVLGKLSATTHLYEVQLSAKELLLLVEGAIKKSSSNKEVRALAAPVSALVKSILFLPSSSSSRRPRKHQSIPRQAAELLKQLGSHRHRAAAH
jgi:hypothetical protein